MKNKNITIDNQGGRYQEGAEYRWDDLIELIFDKNTFPNKKMKILDVGCGEGKLGHFIARANVSRGKPLEIEYIGLDIWPKYRKTVTSFGGKFVCADLMDLPKEFPGQYFDLIIACEIIEHVDETDLFIKTLKKQLKPKGRIYLTTPNLASWHSRLMLLFGYLPLQMEVSNVDSRFGHGFMHPFYYGVGNNRALHHIRCFTLGALKDFLVFHKIAIVQIRGGGYTTMQNLFFKYLPGLSAVFKVICA